MSSDVSCVYSSCACNRSPRALDWGYNNLICYGACNAVQLFAFEKNIGGKHQQTLVGHTNLVTSVQWISKYDGGPETELISTSADKTAAVWTLKGLEFFMSHPLIGHSDVVKTATSLYVECVDGQHLLLATSSADSSIKIWERCNSLVECKQSISLGNGFALDLKLAELKDEHEPILIVGADDTKIHLFIQNENGLFNKILHLDGHEDWIQSLDIIQKENGYLMMASASQDNYIRIWKFSPKCNRSDLENSDLKMEEILFSTHKGQSYSVSLESVLSGHENWIYSVKWRPNENLKCMSQILSASMDKTMIIWEPDSKSKIWMEKVRVGEVGGNTLGFYGGVFSPCGEIIVAHGFQGAIHIWQHNKELDCWQPGISFGGHYDSVQDVDWDPSGEFILSCSYDQTTRLHAPFANDFESNWHEISRPQVHGYDMVCLSTLDRYKFVSSGDEKVLRIFGAPRSFAENLEYLCKLDVSSYLKDALPEGASVPSLGLSNKAVFNDDSEKIDFIQESQQKHAKDHYPDFFYTHTILKAPPTEETLLQNTLWPEIQKLYGHPYEVFTVATNNCKTLIASACKASKLEHAAIILWSTLTWRQIGQILFHNLTVTQLAFSPNDKFLLSVSRDRMWAVYRHFPDESPPYRKVANLDKKNSVHTRIIWTCGWTFDSLYFATASRDKKIAMWSNNSDNESSSMDTFSLSSQALEVEDSATAISIAPCLTVNGRYIVATGLENGCIIICTWCPSKSWSIFQKLNQNIAHHLTVNRLKFSPIVGEAGHKRRNSDAIQLASCGSDCHTKIYKIVISSLS